MTKRTYGKVIPGLKIDGQPAPYGVVNERGIRATAGIMFVIGFFTMLTIKYTGDYTTMYYVVPAFWLDFLLKTFVGPQASIFGFFGRMLVQGQKPEFVGAIQKRFAWGIGSVMATLMMIVGVWLEIRGWAPFAICATCLTFMWMESALGICAGCKIYKYLLDKKILKEPSVRPACPGGACSIKKK
ncbi:hypothetical protein CSB37_01770 [bacterium DOLZORAL124_38_8]|nr:MAG: hypothetical protein CSB37_01770 [bacterium DOLZORAL124_38_8]